MKVRLGHPFSLDISGAVRKSHHFAKNNAPGDSLGPPATRQVYEERSHGRYAEILFGALGDASGRQMEAKLATDDDYRFIVGD